MSRFSAETKKENKHLLITLMLGVVVFGGAVSFLFRNSEEEETKKKVSESIVDITLPTPPPPPPPETDPDLTEPEEADIKEESSEPEIAPTTEMASDSSDLDLGLDPGDLAEGTGGNFVVNVPRFATRGGRGGGGDGMGSDEADSPPTPISKLPPTYPTALLSKGVGGRVMISCVVDASGQVVSSSIKQSSGHSELDKAALAAVARWKFKPAVKDGRSIKSTCSVPFNFEVKKS